MNNETQTFWSTFPNRQEQERESHAKAHIHRNSHKEIKEEFHASWLTHRKVAFHTGEAEAGG